MFCIHDGKTAVVLIFIFFFFLHLNVNVLVNTDNKLPSSPGCLSNTNEKAQYVQRILPLTGSLLNQIQKKTCYMTCMLNSTLFTLITKPAEIPLNDRREPRELSRTATGRKTQFVLRRIENQFRH